MVVGPTDRITHTFRNGRKTSDRQAKGNRKVTRRNGQDRESEEAKQEFQEVCKNLDSRAFTSGGLIQTYKIDYTTMRHNPMGGINVVLIINNDEELTIEYTLNKSNGKLEAGGINYSGKLAELLEEDHNE